MKMKHLAMVSRAILIFYAVFVLFHLVYSIYLYASVLIGWRTADKTATVEEVIVVMWYLAVPLGYIFEYIVYRPCRWLISGCDIGPEASFPQQGIWLGVQTLMAIAQLLLIYWIWGRLRLSFGQTRPS